MEGHLIYESLHLHHQNDSCIKMGSNENHFNVLLIVRDKVTRQCPQTTTFLKRRRPAKRNRSKALLLTSLTLTAGPNRLTPSSLDVRLYSNAQRLETTDGGKPVRPAASVKSVLNWVNSCS